MSLSDQYGATTSMLTEPGKGTGSYKRNGLPNEITPLSPICKCISTNQCVCPYAYMHIGTNLCVHAYMYVCMYAHTHTHVYVGIHVYVCMYYVCMCVCMYAAIYGRDILTNRDIQCTIAYIHVCKYLITSHKCFLVSIKLEV